MPQGHRQCPTRRLPHTSQPASITGMGRARAGSYLPAPLAFFLHTPTELTRYRPARQRNDTTEPGAPQHADLTGGAGQSSGAAQSGARAAAAAEPRCRALPAGRPLYLPPRRPAWAPAGPRQPITSPAARSGGDVMPRSVPPSHSQKSRRRQGGGRRANCRPRCPAARSPTSPPAPGLAPGGLCRSIGAPTAVFGREGLRPRSRSVRAVPSGA